ncbi:MBL fold metallo-hydrolase [Deferribacter autotrophicus]|uniref:MBL fold metallo-hydrolase n=1 Tax=Deferribacter autotrophicus TaxID=500465 RepID=A0A5A8F1D3_9BACT|nr:MBL fold metallo-hydrolase [Deferribacter autotrophicus]KAA0257720.1 MBL fold metallo-hydrolase [Deferribacter autotrophicus]
MIHQATNFYELTAYKLGRFYNAINLTVHFFTLPEIYIDSAQPVMEKHFIEIAKNHIPRYCLLTHYHEDHSGNAAKLKKLFNTKIISHKLSYSYLSNGFKLFPYEKMIWGKPERFTPDLFYKELLDLGKYTFKIIHTPGHSIDSICLLEINRGWLFTGDLYISSKPKYLRKDENIYEILKSLKKVLSLDFEVMFCAHKGIITDNPKLLIKKKITYIEEIIEKAKNLRKKDMSLKKIRNKLLGKEDITSIATNFDFCKLNFIKAIFQEELNEGNGYQ